MMEVLMDGQTDSRTDVMYGIFEVIPLIFL